MSKIAERKALEAYPFKLIECDGGIVDSNSEYRGLYQEGYDKALQDFMERSCKWLRYNTMRELLLDSESTELVEDFVDDFKNYMQNEI